MRHVCWLSAAAISLWQPMVGTGVSPAGDLPSSNPRRCRASAACTRVVCVSNATRLYAAKDDQRFGLDTGDHSFTAQATGKSRGAGQTGARVFAELAVCARRAACALLRPAERPGFAQLASNVQFNDPVVLAVGLDRVKQQFIGLTLLFSRCELQKFDVLDAPNGRLLVDQDVRYHLFGRPVVTLKSLLTIELRNGKVSRWTEEWWHLGERTSADGVIGWLSELRKRATVLATGLCLPIGAHRPGTTVTTQICLRRLDESSNLTATAHADKVRAGHRSRRRSDRSPLRVRTRRLVSPDGRKSVRCSAFRCLACSFAALATACLARALCRRALRLTAQTITRSPNTPRRVRSDLLEPRVRADSASRFFKASLDACFTSLLSFPSLLTMRLPFASLLVAFAATASAKSSSSSKKTSSSVKTSSTSSRGHPTTLTQCSTRYTSVKPKSVSKTTEPPRVYTSVR